LENIRSYLKEKINFPRGTLLLSGDVGSGKSTILLAIDFALFGIRKGDLSGASLLRNDKNRGSVELKFVVDGKEITVKRTLKRTKSGVSQDHGYIIIDGFKKECTPIELKQKIIELLNYPKESLTQSKYLIFRYTVYTPQEEMKQILLGSRDVRLNTLRKVFGIDKYKRIVENCGSFLQALKLKKNELELEIKDLDEKTKEKESYEKELKELEIKYKEIVTKLNLELKNLESLEKKFEEAQKKVEEIKILRTKFESKENLLDSKRKELQRCRTTKEKLENEVSELLKLKVKDAEKIKKKIEEKKNLLKDLNEKKVKLHKAIGEVNSKIDYSTKLIGKIKKMDVCPTCHQKVSEEHKRKIAEEEEKKIMEQREKLKLIEKEMKEMADEISKIEEELVHLDIEKVDAERIKAKLEELELKEKHIEDLIKEEKRIKEEIAELNKERIALLKKLETKEEAENEYTEIKKKVDAKKEVVLDMRNEKYRYEYSIKEIKEKIKKLQIEIEEKIAIKRKVNEISEFYHWLEKHFIKLMEEIEKNVMLKVHEDFNALFEKWFNMLIENENLEISLDEEFTPKIIQNGYDIEYNFLSGGEKTAAALAYRLALNQVINNLMSGIKTNDILILDEPTDGFSSEQLDRMKMVLDELKIAQIILVSHETKIESFVDNIIRFKKEENVSKVFY